MAAQKFMALVGGLRKQLTAIVTSAGAADAGKIAGLGADGRWHSSMMPLGIGASTNQAVASEAIAAGKYINYHNAVGVFSMRLADNSNGRPAHGFVIDAVASAATGTAYPLDGVNSAMTGLVIADPYWLGTAGGATNTPLDEANVANANKISQYLGVAKSATELVTDDDGYVVL